MTGGAARARLMLVLAAVLVHLNALSSPLHLDDTYRIVENPEVRQVFPILRHFTNPRTQASLVELQGYRPLLPLSLSLDHAVHGGKPWGYRATNLALHAGVTLLVHAVAREAAAQLLPPAEGARAPGIAFATALLFAVHPVCGITVNYVSNRDLIMMQLFALASLLVYLRMRRAGDTARGWLLALALAFVAVLSKATAGALAGVVLAYELARREEPGAAVSRALAFVAAAAGVALMSVQLTGAWAGTRVIDERGAPWPYLVVQLQAQVFEYLYNFFWPWHIRQFPLAPHEVSPSDWHFIASVALLLYLVAITAVAVRREPLIGFALLSYIALQVPESSVFPLYPPVVDYRPYSGAPFLFLALASLRGIGRSALWFAVFLVPFALAQNRTWRSQLDLWTHAVEQGGDARAHLGLALALPESEARDRFEELRTALELAPTDAWIAANFGVEIVRQGRPDAGIALCRKVVERVPGAATPHYMLARAYVAAGRLAEAFAESERAVEIAPDLLGYRVSAAEVALDAGHPARALEHLDVLEKLGGRTPATEKLRAAASGQHP